MENNGSSNNNNNNNYNNNNNNNNNNGNSSSSNNNNNMSNSSGSSSNAVHFPAALTSRPGADYFLSLQRPEDMNPRDYVLRQIASGREPRDLHLEWNSWRRSLRASGVDAWATAADASPRLTRQRVRGYVS
ncbi:hypothetical protein BGX20_003703, partial [Mortierella sp. AD010]